MEIFSSAIRTLGAAIGRASDKIPPVRKTIERIGIMTADEWARIYVVKFSDDTGVYFLTLHREAHTVPGIFALTSAGDEVSLQMTEEKQKNCFTVFGINNHTLGRSSA